MKDDFVLQSFLKWLTKKNINLSSKIYIQSTETANYGVFSNSFISQDEILFEIPRKCLLSIENSHLSSCVPATELNGSNWGNLILCIFHELHLGIESQWFEYLQMFPNFENLDLPLMWKNCDLDLLKFTEVAELVSKDLVHINSDYKSYVLPFIEKHPELFDENVTLEKYKKYVAFVMAYSFTEHSTNFENSDEDLEENAETNKPYMVPMADALNHVSRNNAKLTFLPDRLVMVATMDIEAGAEVWNTYGDLPNTMLLHMYGFTLSYEENKDDVVEVDVSKYQEVQWAENIKRRIEIIKKFRPDLIVIVMDRNGFMNTIETAQLLNYLFINEMEFKEWEQEMESSDVNDNESSQKWEELSEDVEMKADMMDQLSTLSRLPTNWKRILALMIEAAISQKQNAAQNVATLAETVSHAKVTMDGRRKCENSLHKTNSRKSSNWSAYWVRKLLDSHLTMLTNIRLHL